MSRDFTDFLGFLTPSFDGTGFTCIYSTLKIAIGLPEVLVSGSGFRGTYSGIYLCIYLLPELIAPN